jgi:hypothetical protein
MSARAAKPAGACVQCNKNGVHGSAAQYLNVTISKQVLHQGSVHPTHASMMNGKAKGQQVAELAGLGSLCFRLFRQWQA